MELLSRAPPSLARMDRRLREARPPHNRSEPHNTSTSASSPRSAVSASDVARTDVDSSRSPVLAFISGTRQSSLARLARFFGRRLAPLLPPPAPCSSRSSRQPRAPFRGPAAAGETPPSPIEDLGPPFLASAELWNSGAAETTFLPRPASLSEQKVLLDPNKLGLAFSQRRPHGEQAFSPFIRRVGLSQASKGTGLGVPAAFFPPSLPAFPPTPSQPSAERTSSASASAPPTQTHTASILLLLPPPPHPSLDHRKQLSALALAGSQGCRGFREPPPSDPPDPAVCLSLPCADGVLLASSSSADTCCLASLAAGTYRLMA